MRQQLSGMSASSNPRWRRASDKLQSPAGHRSTDTATLTLQIPLDMAPVEKEKKATGRPKGGGGKYANLKKMKGPYVPTGNPKGRPSTGLGPYVPTGNPKGRPKGSRKKIGDHLRKTPYQPRGPYVPNGKPKYGRIPKE